MAAETNWSGLVEQMFEQYDRLSRQVVDNLCKLLDEGRRIVNCAEAGLLVPNATGKELTFLASVNSKPGIAETVMKLTVPCEGSIVGCAFNTGQPMAMANPEEYYAGVSEKTGLAMNVYLVAPVVSDEEILGVATFLNRPDDQPQEPFDQSEIEASMKLADLAAAGLKYYRRMEMQDYLFRRDLEEIAERHAFGAAATAHNVPATDDPLAELAPMARLMVQLENMTSREQELAAQMIGALSSYIHEDRFAF